MEFIEYHTERNKQNDFQGTECILSILVVLHSWSYGWPRAVAHCHRSASRAFWESIYHTSLAQEKIKIQIWLLPNHFPFTILKSNNCKVETQIRICQY